jgi:dipeptidyl aminopeptidase/acylaminoacyl peptidase
VGGPEYRLRSPVFAAAAVRQPLLLLHGSDDHVVPPSQSAEMAAAVERAGGAVRHVVLPGEGHGFRRAAGIELAYEEVLEFLGVVFGTDASVDD